VHVTTDADELRPWLERRLALDPVRATVLGTVATRLAAGGGEPWGACPDPGAADPAVAVRLESRFPANLDGPWQGGDVPDLAAALRGLPDLHAVAGESTLVAALLDLLDRPERHRRAMRLHRLERLRPPPPGPGSARRAGRADRPLALDWMQRFSDEVHGDGMRMDGFVDELLDPGGLWLWVLPSGTPVALAGRRPVVAGSARVGPVFTPPEHRGRGYGGAATAAVTADVLADGGIPVLFTDLANPTSNALYARLGYVPVQDRLQVDLAAVP
jgi:RimJ/RimL family protein N-acetyltransferase